VAIGLQRQLRIPHCLDNRHTDGSTLSAFGSGRVLLPRIIIWFPILLETESSQKYSAAGRVR
jgi:hypothetical protein